MEEDVLNGLKSQIAYLPGGCDRDGRLVTVINVASDLQLWNRKCLEVTINYVIKCIGTDHLEKGIAIIADAQKCPNRLTKTQTRSISSLFGDIPITVFLVRPEGFWEKHMEQCTKSQSSGEPIIVSKSRLLKYFEIDELPLELGGTIAYNHDLWVHHHIQIDEYKNKFEDIVNDLDNLHVQLLEHKSLRPTEADQELKSCYQQHARVQSRAECVIEAGNRLVTSIADAYSPGSSSTHIRMPQDLKTELSRMAGMLSEVEAKKSGVREARSELERSLADARELATLEEGVSFVTNWILGTAEIRFNAKQSIGCDVPSSEELRRDHEAFEMECRETYGFYAELLYKIDSYRSNKETFAYKDLMSQKDFMDFVCRSFASRLERRRKMLLTALRFFRLVSEYFDRTSAVFESLVMGNKMDDFDAAEGTLQQLKDSQQNLENVERDVIKEGEKLSDMLSMPLKDAMGRDLSVDYSDDIANIRDILDATIARRNIFIDSVELQKLTLEQVAHIHTYEQDAKMAIKWMDDLYNVMIKCHSHVGCNVHEIQVQKDDLQTFQETGKSIYDYGWQLLEASKALRLSCKLDAEISSTMSNQLKSTWQHLQAVSQEHMTRLRVSAVFHRSVAEYCNKLHDLKTDVIALGEIAASEGGGEAAATMEDVAERQRQRLRRYLALRERLLVEVGRMVRLGRLLKTRLKEPFVLDDDQPSCSENGEPTTDAKSDDASISSASSSSHQVRPTGNNAIACDAISNKLTEIAEVAESLDATLRETQNGRDVAETNSSSSEKKSEHNRSGSVDEWSTSIRSTEDESYVSADGNFGVPYSRSSSFHTASYLSSDKDAGSDLEECPDIDLDTPVLHPAHFNGNVSFDSSDPSFRSAEQSFANSPEVAPAEAISHSRSATPTPDNIDTLKQNGDDNRSEVRVCELTGSAAPWSSRYYQNVVAKQTIKGFL